MTLTLVGVIIKLIKILPGGVVSYFYRLGYIHIIFSFASPGAARTTRHNNNAPAIDPLALYGSLPSWVPPHIPRSSTTRFAWPLVCTPVL